MSLNNKLNIYLFYLLIIVFSFPLFLFDPINLQFQGNFSRSLNLIGESFYMNQSLSLPLFSINNFSYPPGTNLVYTDSLPFFGLICKFVSNIINIKFWYSPIYQLLSLSLNGFVAYLIFIKLTKNNLFSIIAGLFFLFIPFHIDRFDRFPSLTSHFMLFLAYLIHLHNPKKKLLYNFFLIFISIGTHFYIATMTIMIILILELIKYNEYKNLIKNFIIYILTIFLSLFFYGYFLTDNPSAFDNYGIFSTNIISLINPIIYTLSNIIFGSFKTMSGQYEGNAWLGIGGIMVLFFSLFKILIYREKISILLIIFLIFVFLFSISNKIYLSNILLIDFEINTQIKKLLNIWQSSGRFIWIIAYSVLFYGINSIYQFYYTKHILFFNKFTINLPVLILSFITFLQITDCLYLVKGKFNNSNSINSISNGIENVLNKFNVDHFHADFWDPQIAFAAYLLNKSTSIRYNARPLKNDDNVKYPYKKSYVEFLDNPLNEIFQGELCTFEYEKDGFSRVILYKKNKFFDKNDFCFNYEFNIKNSEVLPNLLKNKNSIYYIVLLTKNKNLDISSENFNANNFANYNIYSNNDLLINIDDPNLLSKKFEICDSELKILINKNNYTIYFLNLNFTSLSNNDSQYNSQLIIIDKNCKKISNILIK